MSAKEGRSKIIRITTVAGSLSGLLKGQLSYMQQYFDVVGVASGSKKISEVAEREGVRVVEVEMTRSIAPIRDLISLVKIYRLFMAEKPDIIHTHTPKAGFLGQTAAWLRGVPVRLHTVAGLPLMESVGIKRILLEFIEMLTYLFSTMVYPNSFGLRNYIISRNLCKPSKLKIISEGSSNGINAEYFSRKQVSEEIVAQMRKHLLILQKDFVFIFIGRLVSDKGINELVEAFVEMSQRQQVKLLLVGAEEQKLDPLLPSTLELMNNHPNIVLTGHQVDVRPYLSISDVLVFPSYREGLPNVPMQALAMEIPCIASNIIGNNEVVIDRYNGLLFEMKDKMLLLNSMESIINDNRLYKELKSNSRKSVIEKFSQQRVWENIKEEY